MPVYQSVLVISAAMFLCWLALWRWRRVFHPRASLLDHPFIFFILVFSAMLALRWVTVVFPAERNVDESQMVAQGMRFVSHPVPWRDVDSTTSGPLNSLLLSVPFSCGAPPTWETARLVLFAANCAVVLLIYFSVRCVLTRPEAQFALLPLVLFYGFTSSWDYTHYSSETLSSVLLAAGLYLLAQQWRSGTSSKAPMFLLGVLLGAVPFAKLQAAPLAAFLGATVLGLIIVEHRKNGKAAGGVSGEIITLMAGAVLVPALILGTVAATGAFDDFWKSYILATRKDAATEHALSSQTLQALPSPVRRLLYIGYILLSPLNLGLYFLSGLGVLAVLWGICRAKKIPFPAEVRGPLIVMGGYACLVIVCIFTAGKPFAHYGILMLMPLAGLTGLVFFAGKSVLGLDGNGLFGKRWLVVFAIVLIVPQLGLGPFRIYQRVTARDGDPDWWAPSVYKYARPVVRPGDTLSIWGWMPQLYVQMGLPPATRDAVSHYAVSSFYQDYYRQRYLDDLKRAKPAIFIDVVGDGGFPAYSKWTAAQKHECFPELAKFIGDNYSLFTSVQLRPTKEVGSIRVYVLKERLSELHLPPVDPSAPPVNDFPPDSLPGWHSKR
jgi:hypothetical protein